MSEILFSLLRKGSKGITSLQQFYFSKMVFTQGLTLINKTCETVPLIRPSFDN